MPDKTSCPRCKKTGLVRFENVITAGKAERHYYCGGCHHAWVVREDGTAGKDDGDSFPPEPSRPAPHRFKP